MAWQIQTIAFTRKGRHDKSSVQKLNVRKVHFLNVARSLRVQKLNVENPENEGGPVRKLNVFNKLPCPSRRRYSGEIGDSIRTKREEEKKKLKE